MPRNSLHLARPAQARLNLVANEQYIMLLADLSAFGQVSIVWHVYAAMSAIFLPCPNRDQLTQPRPELAQPRKPLHPCHASPTPSPDPPGGCTE
jgi:hypothetical protein